jgi:hypothetical protein
MSAPSVAELEIVDGNVRGNIIPVGSPACNYLKYADELARKEKSTRIKKIVLITFQFMLSLARNP